ncbi:hypothetical protein ACFLUT_00360 [Chloroflexota bacterium]
MRTREQSLLLVVLVIGGLAVLTSYVQGFLTHPDSRWAIWGGIPSALKPVYTVSMLLATAGYFPMTTFFLLRVDARSALIAGRFGYGLAVLSYAAILVGSAAWMPLTYATIEAPSVGIWVAIRVVLGIVALGGLGLLFALLTLNQKTPPRWHRLAILGSVFFCWQTVVLDALVWPYYFPL